MPACHSNYYYRLTDVTDQRTRRRHNLEEKTSGSALTQAQWILQVHCRVCPPICPLDGRAVSERGSTSCQVEQHLSHESTHLDVYYMLQSNYLIHTWGHVKQNVSENISHRLFMSKIFNFPHFLSVFIFILLLCICKQRNGATETSDLSAGDVICSPLFILYYY